MKVVIIGSGLGGLASAILCARKGYSVSVYEKNEMIGGRSHIRQEKGFTFDMGPSWMLMEEVFRNFFSSIGEDIDKYMNLVKLSPSYNVFFLNEPTLKKEIRGEIEKDLETFEGLEIGAKEKMKEYFLSSRYQYETAMNEFVNKNMDSVSQFFNRKMISQAPKLHLFENFERYVSRFTRSPEIKKLLAYPLIFLGVAPKNSPAFYNILNRVDFGQGVYYPMGGIYEIPKALYTIAQKYDISFHTRTTVERIIVENGKARGVEVNGTRIDADIVISNADYAFTEINLLAPEHQTYPASYRKKKVFSPSCFLMYLGVKGKVKNLVHHNMIFAKDWNKNFDQVFVKKEMPTDPSLYVCCPSKTDPSVAPEGDENIFVLVPIPYGISLSDDDAQAYRNKIISLLEECTEDHISDRIVVEKLFYLQDFTRTYHAYEGSALGLAHTLDQSAIFRPNNISKKVRNLYYVGHSTNPGIGMPMVIISAQNLDQRITSLI